MKKIVHNFIRKKALQLIFTCILVLSLSIVSSQNVISVSTNEDGFVIDFTLPSYQVADTNIFDAFGINQDYSIIEIENFGEMVDSGYPNLPQYTFDLHIPRDATTFNVSVSNKQSSATQLTNKILPFQDLGEDDTLVFAFDTNYYASNGALFSFDYQISDTFDIMGASGISFSIFPFHYNPGADSLKITQTCRFTITHNGSSSLLLKPDSANSEVKNHYLANVFVNYPSPKSTSANMGKYLIITDPDFENTLLYFANYKRNIGYDVTVVSTSVIGASSYNIKDYLQLQYNNSSTRPDFVLLVGDQCNIPASGGNTMGDVDSDPLTDLNYSRLSGSDYFADVFIGRFSVLNNPQLQSIIYKTIYMETNLHTINKNALLLAGGLNDDWPHNEDNSYDNPQRWVMDNVLGPQGFDYDFLFRIDGAERSDAINALNNDYTLFIYRGHASFTILDWDGSFLFDDGDFNLTGSDINNSTSNIYPFGFSFACKSNNFGQPYYICFGEDWIRSNQGGISYFGATTSTNSHTNNVIEENVFDYMDDEDQLSPFINLGMKEYYRRTWSWLNGGRRNRHMKSYNLLGDPSIFLYGIGCQDDFIFSNNEVFHNGDRITYHASIDIETCDASTTFVAQAGSVVNLVSGNSITLQPGFIANQGSSFVATIAPCNNGISNKAVKVYSMKESASINAEIKKTVHNVVTIYPNPANNTVNFYLNFYGNKIKSIMIFDVLGNKQIEVVYNNLSLNHWHNLEIDISRLPKGAYFCLITYNGGYEKGKFVKL